jgi:Spy/CpxP family protein refolding chaperone
MKKTITAVAVLALSASLAVAAPYEGKQRRGKRGEFGPRLEQKLNLSDAQKQQARELRELFRAENEPLRAQFRQTFTELKAAKNANDTARVDALKGTMRSLREQMRTRRTEQREQFKALLTADQRAQLDAMKAERKQRRGKQ